MLVIASLVALLVGPVLHRVAEKARWALATLDGFVLVALGGLILLHVLPHSLELAGVWALVAGIVGLLVPGALHKLLTRRQGKAGPVLVPLALAGLVVHALLDGVALAAPSGEHAGEHSEMLALAVVLHRLPVGLALWWMSRPAWGRLAAFGVLALNAVATVVGATVGASALEGTAGAGLATFQALVAGSLLHVLFEHSPGGKSTEDRSGRLLSGIGALLAVVMLWAMTLVHPEAEHAGAMHSDLTLTTLALEVAPVLLLAYLLAGALYASRPSPAWLVRGGAFSQTLRATLLGMSLPPYSCEALPLYRSMLARGGAVAAAVALIVAERAIGLDAALLSIPLLGPRVAAVRIAGVVLVAALVGVAVGLFATRHCDHEKEHEHHHAPAPQDPPLARARFGFLQTLDHAGPWMVVGLAAAALLEPLLPPGSLAELPRGLDVALMALLGLPAYFCAAAITPVAALLLHKGLSAGAALALLITGPGMSLTSLSLLSRMHGRRAAVVFALSMLATAVGAGYALDLLVPASTFPLHELAHEPPGWLHRGCLGILGLLFVGSLLRNGPRGLVLQILPPHLHVEHDHAPAAEEVGALVRSSEA